MADNSIKPHTRQKMRLLTQKKMSCVECAGVTRKRHILLCFHCYCEKCYNNLAKGLMGLETGLVCTICKTFEPYNQREEKDDGPPVYCKVHTSNRYLLNCVTCNQILCYRCKMGEHYYHQSETVQAALDRIIPFVKNRSAEEEEQQQSSLRKKVMENGGQIRQIKEKIEKLDSYLKEERNRLDIKLREDFKKVKNMKEDETLRRRGILDRQTEMIKYFQKIKLPFHGVELCPDEGGIEMIKLAACPYDCVVGKCKPIYLHSDDEDDQTEEKDKCNAVSCKHQGSDKCQSLESSSKEGVENKNIQLQTDNSETKENCTIEDKNMNVDVIINDATSANCSSSNVNNCDNHNTDNKQHEDNKENVRPDENVNCNSDNRNSNKSNKSCNKLSESSDTNCTHNSDSINNNSSKNDNLNCECSKADAEFHNNKKNHNHNHCKTVSKQIKKSWKERKQDKNLCRFKESCHNEGYIVKNIDEETCIATLEKNGEVSTITLLCEECENKRKGIDTLDYSEVDKALESKTEIEIGQTKVGNEIVSVRYTPTNVDTTKLFDKVDFDRAGNLIDIETGHIMVDNIVGKVEIVRAKAKKDDSHLKELHQALIDKAHQDKIDANELLEETCSCYDKVEFHPISESFRNATIDLLSLPSKKLKYNGFFCYGSPKLCYRLCRNNNRVYLPCYDDNKYFIMQFHAITGCLIKNGRPPPNIETPQALYPLNYDQMILASKSGLHLIGRDLKLVCKLLKGQFYDVSFQCPRIAALETYKSHVHIIDISTKPPTYESMFHVEETSTDTRTLVLHGDAVFVACSDNKIKKYSLKGELLWQWGSFGDGGPGFLHNPNICSVDRNESLLVVDTANERLQVVDSKCQWKILELKEVESPSDAMVSDDGMLYVLSQKKSMIYWYTFDV